MKYKFFYLLFFLVVFNTLKASEPLPLKEGSQFKSYNELIIDFNYFKKKFYKEVVDFCYKQMMPGGGAEQLIDSSRCQYRASVDLAKEHKLFYGEFRKELYSWHKNLFSLSKNAALAELNCKSTSCQDKVFLSYANAQISLEDRLMQTLDRIVPQMAAEFQLGVN